MKIRFMVFLMIFTLILSCVACSIQRDIGVSLGQNGEGSVENITDKHNYEVFGNDSTGKSIHTNTNIVAENEYEETITMYVRGDYSVCKIVDIYELVDLAVVVQFNRHIETYAMDISGFPITVSEFQVKEVLKGNYDKDFIPVHYIGGTISLYEHMQKLTDSALLKAGYDYTEEEAKNIGVSFEAENPIDEFYEDGEYLLLINYSQSEDIYAIAGDGFGVAFVEDDAVYDEIEQAYIKLSELRN